MSDHKHEDNHGHRPKSFRIIVDHKPHDWPDEFISGAQIKQLAGVDPVTFGAWQDVPGPEDVPVDDNDKVDLRRPGAEKFFTGKKTTTEG